MNGELEYEVKEVLDSRVQRNKLQYLVEWNRYGPEERAWEPVENLENAKETVTEFHHCHLNRPSEADLTNRKSRRSSVHKKGDTVINDSQTIPAVTSTGSN